MNFDVIVVGAGHAGCEASLASAKLGCSVLCVTMNLETIAEMPCNPSIGGLAKGHLVKEIDALGGEMAKIADISAIQYRRLNTKKGPAVQSTRIQADKWIYKGQMKKSLFEHKNITILESEIVEIIINGSTARGVKTKLGEIFNAKAVIITTGTFLKGLIHVGLESYPAGRLGEFCADSLSGNLLKLGFTLGRLKTGTNARLDKRTINFDSLIRQNGDIKITPFSIQTKEITNPQLPCYITHTNEKTHEIIKSGIDRSPLYTGKIKGVGPRYCPSIEDKVFRFSDKLSHQIFLEPMGLGSFEIYANGISTSLPIDIQHKFIQSIHGLEEAKVLKYGYAIEYDFIHPVQLKSSLESKKIKNLFFAGQINGTSGYEEAAGQGLIAGINAAHCVADKEPFVLTRQEAYIGVLIDDLVTKGTEEPYRMFTSRAEYRLLLREDNAYERLTEKGHSLGVVSNEMYDLFLKRKSKTTKLFQNLKTTKINPTEANNQILEKIGVERIKNQTTFFDLLRRPGVFIGELNKFIEESKIESDIDFSNIEDEISNLVETEIKYEGYLTRELEKIKKMSKIEELIIPSDIDYFKVSGLSNEVKGKLSKIMPKTFGQVSRIQGVTPSAIEVLFIHLLDKSGKREYKGQI